MNLLNQNFENSISLIKKAQHFRRLMARNRENFDVTVGIRFNSELRLSSSILQTLLHRKRKQSWLLQQSVMLMSESWLLTKTNQTVASDKMCEKLIMRKRLCCLSRNSMRLTQYSMYTTRASILLLSFEDRVAKFEF